MEEGGREGSDGKRTEGKKSFGRGEKTTGFPRIVQKWESRGKTEKLLVKCLELRIMGHTWGQETKCRGKRRSENGSWWTAWKNKMSDLP